MAGSLVTNYLIQGTAASRPASPSAATNTLTFYFATDTETLSFYDWTDAAWQDVGTPGGTAALTPPRGRLTLTSATPVLTADVTGATTIYYALYNGNHIPLYDGSSFSNNVFTELSQATTDSTKSPAAVANNSNYDIFGWTDGGTLRATRGPAWTSDTSRGTGAGTTELTRVNGIWLNAVSITNGPSASRGTYLGTVRSNGTASIDMKFGGTGAVGGESTACHVWNAYNRRPIKLTNYDTTDSWNYTTATWRVKNNNTANNITVIVGLSEDMLFAVNSMVSGNSSAGISRSCAIGINSTTTWPVGKCSVGYGGGLTAGQFHVHPSTLETFAPLGFTTLSPIEHSTASGTTTWIGDNGDAGAGTQTASSVFYVHLPA